MSRDNKIEGIGSIIGGEYDTVKIEGVGKIKGDVKCEELLVEGLYKGRGRVQATRFSCEGMGRIHKDMKARTVNIQGMVKLKGAKLEAETILCEGMLTCTEEVSADEIVIEGICSIAKMYGDKIKISADAIRGNTRLPKGLGVFARSYIGRRVSQDHCIVDMIECSELEADYLEAKVIKAHSIKLGPECKVDLIECDGLLEYDATCKIGKIIAREVRKQSYASIENKGEMEMADIKLTKVLDMYKENKINADEAEKMLKSLGVLGGSRVSEESPRFSDDKLRVVVMRGDKLISQKEYSKGMTINVEYQGNLANVECWGNLTCDDIKGNATAGGNIEAGDIGNNATAGGNMSCDDVGGNVSVGGNITCKDVGGKISAGGDVSIQK